MTAKALKERNIAGDISHFQCSLQIIPANQGRRASLRLALALAIVFRAFGAARLKSLPIANPVS